MSATKMTFGRPHSSATCPPKIDPTTAPKSAMDTNSPRSALESWNSSLTASSVVAMMDVS